MSVPSLEELDAKVAQHIVDHGPLSKKEKKHVARLRDLLLGLHEWTERDKSAPFDPVAFSKMLGQARAFIDVARQARGAKPDADYVAGTDALKKLQDLLDPQKRLKMILSGLLERIHTKELEATTVDAALTAFDKLADDKKQQLQYMLSMIATEDAFGVVVRGHVLVENTLDSCIYAAVPKPRDLFKDLRLFGIEKIRLAQMLGVLSSDEENMLTTLNALRNKVAHVRRQFPEIAEPDFEVKPKDERDIWLQFVGNISKVAGWPKYREEDFPLNLRYVYLHLYLVLSRRVDLISERGTKSIAEAIEPDDQQKMALPLLTILFAKVFATIAKSTQPGP